jgi:hypothetical protein
LAGDWHGNIPFAMSQVDRIHMAGAHLIVQLGDFGFWRDDPATRKYLSRLDRSLATRDMQLAWIDGNHEDHARLNLLPVDVETGLRPNTPRITHNPRGYRWVWGGATWMGLGGAHSVDRLDRVPGQSWWPQEYLTYEDVTFASRPGRVDVLLTHDAPLGVDIPALRGPSLWPVEEIELAQRHQALIAQVAETVHPAALFHGHMHCAYRDALRHADGSETQVRGLGADVGQWRENLAFVDSYGRDAAADIGFA